MDNNSFTLHTCSECGEKRYGVNGTFEGFNFKCKYCITPIECKHCAHFITPELQIENMCNACWGMLGISRIVEDVYVSDYYSSQLHSIIRDLGIRQILTIGTELRSHNFKDGNTLHIRLHDHPEEELSRYFTLTNAFIDCGPTLIHCHAGISRSTTVAIAYLMYRYDLSHDFARKVVIDGRPITHPNQGFTIQLENYEKMIQNTNSSQS